MAFLRGNGDGLDIRQNECFSFDSEIREYAYDQLTNSALNNRAGKAEEKMTYTR